MAGQKYNCIIQYYLLFINNIYYYTVCLQTPINATRRVNHIAIPVSQSKIILSFIYTVYIYIYIYILTHHSGVDRGSDGEEGGV